METLKNSYLKLNNLNNLIVSENTFFNYFNQEGSLKNEIPQGSTLVFQGKFNLSNINNITINKPVNIIGNNCEINDLSFILDSDDINFENMNINIKSKNLNYGIIVNGEYISLLENNITFTCFDSSSKSSAIKIDSANGLNLIANEIYFNSNCDGTENHYAVSIANSNDIIIENNLIKSNLPSLAAEYSPIFFNPIYKTLGLFIHNCSDLDIINNILFVYYDGLSPGADTIVNTYLSGINNAEIKGNNFITGGHSYAYGLFLNGYVDEDSYLKKSCFDVNITNNIINTHVDNYYACGLEIGSPVDACVFNNFINAEAPAIVYSVLAYPMGTLGSVSVKYESNNIVGTANSVYGMELLGTEQEINFNNILLKGNFTVGIATKASKSNNIFKNNISAIGSNLGNPTNGDIDFPSQNTGILLISPGQINAVNNDIITSGKYAVNLTDAGSSNIKSLKNIVFDNFLKSDSNSGNDCVYSEKYSSKNIVKKNGSLVLNTPLTIHGMAFDNIDFNLIDLL